MTPASPLPGARIIGAHRGDESGPTLLCIAALHGNEPAGVRAVQRVLGRLTASGAPFRGSMIGLSGNLTALDRGDRFIDEDLNRVWQTERVAAVLASLRSEASRAPETASPGAPRPEAVPMVGSVELAEQRDLLDALRAAARELGDGPVYLIDLHTTSSESAPFTTLGDTLQNRRLAFELPIPVVLGLEEQIDGAMLQYFDRLGWPGIGIEGGAHDNPASIDAHEDALWVLLAALGFLAAADVPDLEERRRRLAVAARELPRVVDVRYRHAIAEEDRFRMDPGFRNFQPVRKGQRVGSDARGSVVAPVSGRIFMPLYQKQGDDGFFIVRRLSPVWLEISRWLRAGGGADRATWIPGVVRHPDRDDAVILTRWAANRCVIGILHLLGYNIRRRGRDDMLMVRRVEESRPGGPLDLRS